jgi:transcriptional regulator with XRE-family HTH domain
VLSVEDWAEIRRLRRAEQMPVAQIARVLGISRNTVKAALASDGPPKYRRPHPLLIIDEAHLLDHDQLESIRMLTNHDMDSRSPFACLLIGQPTLRRMIKLGVLAALDQRIAVRYQMTGMTPDETTTYITHHLQLAGRTSPLFSERRPRPHPRHQPRQAPHRQQPRPRRPGRHLRRRQETRRRDRRTSRRHRSHRDRVSTPPTPRTPSPARHSRAGLTYTPACSPAMTPTCSPRKTGNTHAGSRRGLRTDHRRIR